MRILIILLSLASVLPLLAIECGDPGFTLEGSSDPVFTPMWSLDGSQILLPHLRQIYSVDANGRNIQSISEPFPSVSKSLYADFSPDVSSDGSRVVFATSRHFSGSFPRNEVSLEIGTSNLDGSDYKRLKDTKYHEANPTWSHDGSRIAFIQSGIHTLHTMAADGSDVRDLTPQNLSVANIPPVWSPDGTRIAFQGYQIEPIEVDYRGEVLFTVASDGSDPRTVSRIEGQPAWSPDGTRVAFWAVDKKHTTSGTLQTARWDGSDLQTAAGSQESNTVPSYFSVSNLSWSPDGSEIRFTADVENERGSEWPHIYGIHGVKADASDHRLIASGVGGSSLINLVSRRCQDCSPTFWGLDRSPRGTLHS